jgi:hypothetical protein
MLRRLFLLRDGTQHVARTRNVRQVDLGLEFIFAVNGRPGWSCGSRTSFSVGTETLAHQFGFVLFQRTGMRLLLRNADLGQDVKNGLALDLQLTGQIIDSNLHPLFVSFSCPALLRLLTFTLAYLASRNPESPQPRLRQRLS